MRSSVVIVGIVVGVLAARAASADPAVLVPYDGDGHDALAHGKCAKWSTGLVGTVCSFCMDDTDKGCRMCRDGFGSATCSYAARDAPPTFGTCEAVGDDMVCRDHDERCRYSATRSACYAGLGDLHPDDTAWIDARPHCTRFAVPLRGRACVVPAQDGIHGSLCFAWDDNSRGACVEVADPHVEPTFGTCTADGWTTTCTIANLRCTYARVGPAVTCEDATAKPAHAEPKPDGERGGHLPSTVAVGLEVGYARPGAGAYFANGYGRAFVLAVLGFELRVFEGYDLPDLQHRYTNVAGTSSAFVVSSLAYRYQLASSSPVALSVLGGLAVSHRSQFGVSGDQIPGYPDFPEVQQQLGVGLLAGVGAVFYGLAYVDVRAYPTWWGALGVGDNAAAPGGIPVTVNAGFLVGF